MRGCLSFLPLERVGVAAQQHNSRYSATTPTRAEPRSASLAFPLKGQEGL